MPAYNSYSNNLQSMVALKNSIRRLGFTPASTFNDALEIASDVVGRSPTITHFHTPPIMIADVK